MSDFAYPGLRPFARDESDIFFGREVSVDRLLEKLDDSHFLAVVGPSGCGKSSLVRAGMIPALETGFMASAGARWQVAEMRPGNRPLSNLAEALLKVSPLQTEHCEMAHAAAFLNSTLRRGPLALAEVLRETPLPEHMNLLLLVDQFEEIFRYRRERNRDEGDAFVALLLTTAAQQDVPAYIVITMRSDFLGHCTVFEGLPEAINESQFLTPRLTRRQLRDAIVGPARVFGSDVESTLVNRLLNDMGPDPNRLPLMQHALSRMWNVACPDLPTKSQTDETDKCTLTLAHYDRVGGLADALSMHADKAYNELSNDQKRIAETIFKCLSESGPNNLPIRHPTSLKDIAAVADVPEAEVKEVIDVFREPGRSFLTPPINEDLKSESLIDISHESLIPNWDKLRSWLDEESESATMYRRLAETAVLYRKKHAGLWGEPDLQLALKWREIYNPNKSWAMRYHPEFDAAIEFLEESERDFYTGIEEKKRVEADKLRAELRAEEQVKIADMERKRANAERELAKAERERAEQAQRLADVKAKSARLRGRLIAALVVLVMLAIVACGWAIWNQLIVNKIVKAQELATQARFTSNQQANKLQLSMLLAVESMKRYPSLEADQVLRKGLALLPRAVACLAYESGVEHVAFSPDGKSLVTVTDPHTAQVWEIASGKKVNNIDLEKRVSSIIFSPDGKSLVTVTDPNTAQVWEIASSRKVHHMSQFKGVYKVVLSPDGKYLATASAGDNTARVWRVPSNQEVAREVTSPMKHNDYIRDLVFSPDGKYLATTSWDNTAHVWDATIGKVVKRLNLEKKQDTIAVSSDGEYLATTSWDNAACVWEVKSGKVVKRLTLENQVRVYSTVFSPDAKYLATLNGDNTVRVWEVASGKEVTRVIHEDPVFYAAFLQSGRYLVTAGKDNTARVWEITDGREEKHLNHENAVRSVAFSPDGKYLATASEGNAARVWEVTVGKEKDPMEHEKRVNAVAFSPDGKYLATASWDKTACVWDVSLGREVARMNHEKTVWCVAFSPDGKYLATASDDNTARVWEVSSGNEVKRVLHDKEVVSVAFSPDGKYLATASWDNTARVWDGSQGREVARMNHEKTVWCVAFSPDGKYLATGSDDKVAHIWLCRPKELITEAYRRLTRNLTDDEWKLYFPGEPYPKTCPDLPIHSSVLKSGEDLAKSSAVDGKVRIFHRIQKAEPGMELDSDAEARLLAVQVGILP